MFIQLSKAAYNLVRHPRISYMVIKAIRLEKKLGL